MAPGQRAASYSIRGEATATAPETTFLSKGPYTAHYQHIMTVIDTIPAFTKARLPVEGSRAFFCNVTAGLRAAIHSMAAHLQTERSPSLSGHPRPVGNKPVNRVVQYMTSPRAPCRAQPVSICVALPLPAKKNTGPKTGVFLTDNAFL